MGLRAGSATKRSNGNNCVMCDVLTVGGMKSIQDARMRALQRCGVGCWAAKSAVKRGAGSGLCGAVLNTNSGPVGKLQTATSTITIITIETLHPSRAIHCNLDRSSSGDRQAASRDAGKEDQENNAASQSSPPTSPSQSTHQDTLGEDAPIP